METVSYLRESQSSLATLDHKNITLVSFSKQQSSKKRHFLEDGECPMKTSWLSRKEENSSLHNSPEVLGSHSGQVSLREQRHPVNVLVILLCSN